MAKVGKDKPEVDPFSAGSKAFGALDEALGALDEEPAAARTRKTGTAANDGAKASGPRKEVPRKTTKLKSGRRTKELHGKEPRGSTATASAASKRARRFLATDEEMANWQRAAMRLGAATGARIDFSKMTRALWEIYLRHEEDVVRNLPDEGQWDRPSNSDAVGLAELDERLTELVNEGFMLAGRRPRNRPDRED